MIRPIACLAGLLLLATAASAADAIASVQIPVSQLDRAAAFYTGTLGFEPAGPDLFRLGRERIELIERYRRPLPADSRSNDLWFQHLAIIVSDMDKAYAAVLRAGAAPISLGGPQLLPAWNPHAGGIRAFYFRDPDEHPLELIQFSPGKGDPRWQAKDRLFLGIDHTAIAIADTARSLDFCAGRLGLLVAGRSENWGVEQERLSAVPGAHLRITTLRGDGGPGVELLNYLTPIDGRPMPADTTPDDLWAEVIVLRAATGGFAHDPDGHAIRFIADPKEALR
jgi:catechol 2,3-dioxygenase-like lactoylglutathione lyase family enzyme